jgi:hypothetical protein
MRRHSAADLLEDDDEPGQLPESKLVSILAAFPER